MAKRPLSDVVHCVFVLGPLLLILMLEGAIRELTRGPTVSETWGVR